jgi:hypothetical protein
VQRYQGYDDDIDDYLQVDFRRKLILPREGSKPDKRFSVLQLHRWFQGIGDESNPNYTGGIIEDEISARDTDRFIQIINGFIISDDALDFICGGTLFVHGSETNEGGIYTSTLTYGCAVCNKLINYCQCKLVKSKRWRHYA